MWDTETGEIVSGPFVGHTGPIWSVALSHNSKYIVPGSMKRAKTICVWDTETGKIISSPFKGHTGEVTSVGFSQDSQHIVSGYPGTTQFVHGTEALELF